MNDNDEHLSLGNLFRIIKDSSKNKYSALQSELFCVLFDLEGIHDTTVNNYCVGCRSIGSEYKQIYLNKEKKYKKEKEIFCDNIIGVLSIVDGVVYTSLVDKIAFIDCSETALLLAKKMYNLAKNDRQVSGEFTEKLHSLLNDQQIYACLVEELLFIVLEKKQPLYEENLKKEVLENVLNDTSISSVDLQEYLSLKLREGINFDYSMKRLAEMGNAYANFELGFNEYYGYVKGVPRYDYAYRYLQIAASLNHASANYMLGNMYVRGIIGSRSDEELEKGYTYLVKSSELGNIAALNTLGNMYLKGIFPVKKDKQKAISLYEKAAANQYAFAYNNLGKICEEDEKYAEAFSYYLLAADLGESWACNKVGEYYRQGIVQKDMQKAYQYYRLALESNYRTLCYYAYYNLAEYFYKEGYDGVVLKKDEQKYEEYMTIAGEHGVLEALLALFRYTVACFLQTRDVSTYEKIFSLKLKIEQHEKYNLQVCEQIEKELEVLKEKRSISVQLMENL